MRNLEPHTHYRVRVRAFIDEEGGEWSEPSDWLQTPDAARVYELAGRSKYGPRTARRTRGRPSITDQHSQTIPTTCRVLLLEDWEYQDGIRQKMMETAAVG